MHVLVFIIVVWTIAISQGSKHTEGFFEGERYRGKNRKIKFIVTIPIAAEINYTVNLRTQIWADNR